MTASVLLDPSISGERRIWLGLSNSIREDLRVAGIIRNHLEGGQERAEPQPVLTLGRQMRVSLAVHYIRWAGWEICHIRPKHVPGGSRRAVEGVAQGDNAAGIRGLLGFDGNLRDAAGLVERERGW
jgi:hypothetical protein